MSEEDWVDEEEDDDFRYRECYEFNKNLNDVLDDGRCIHCRKYLTVQCEYIDEFLDEE